MKIEHLLARHLYNAKTLTLQGIGTFSLPGDFVMPGENDKINEIPQGAITFVQNTKAAEDADLINFIVQHTRKMKALASSDLESFIGLGTQFLNIGKPFKLEGIGMLEKNQLGEYQFTQYGQIVSAKVEEIPTQVKEKREETISFAEDKRKTGTNSKKALLAILALVVLGGTITAVWYYFSNKKNQPETLELNTAPPVAPLASDTVKKDTLPSAQNVPPVVTPNAGNNNYTFKVVIKNYPSLTVAQKRFDILTSYGHKLIMYTTDSVTYKVAMPFTRPLADTTYAKDSVRKSLFGGNPYIELK